MTSLLSGLLDIHCKGCCPHTSCLLSVLRGFRNGAVYGAKIRFPHALVMTMLFRDGSLESKIKAIFKLTYQHSRNLAIFVAIFKSICCLLRHIRQKESGLNHLIAGAIGGFIMFGEDNPVNSQINMYILSRISWGLVRTAVRHGWIGSFEYAYPMYAGAIWALVMYLFEFQKGTLQSSLISSMTYLYQESNTWPQTSNPIEWLKQ